MIDIKRGRYVERIAEEWLDVVKDFFNTPGKPYLMIGKKRRYFTDYGEKLKYQCMQAVLGCTRDQRLRRKYIAQLEYWWLNIDNIILSTPAAMEAQIRIWDKKIIGQTRLLEVLSDILEDYYDTVSKKHGLKLEEMLNIKTCPYCNRQFIYTFQGKTPDNKERVERPELDHFYPKKTYPLYCLSFYNLIPACHSCNHVKSDSKIGVNPYQRAFRGNFVLTDKNGKILTKAQIYRLTKKEIRLKFDRRDCDEEKNVSVLGLENVYNKHTDYIKELIDKSMEYDKHARQALVTTFQGAGYHPRQVYDFVWGRHLMDAQYEDRPLSKLTKEILDLLDIRRG